MIMENIENRIKRMVMDSDIVYLDGMIIKDRDKEPTHPNLKEVMENINKYYVTFFNRDSNNGKRCLKLNSVYVSFKS